MDIIKQLLKVNKNTKKPRLFIFKNKETKPLIAAFKSLERETYENEDVKGTKDKIREGKHDAHAALRYVFQSTVPWLPPQASVPEYETVNETTG